MTSGTARRVQYVSLAEARQSVSFSIRLPAWVPQGLTLAGALSEGANGVHVQYYGYTPGGRSALSESARPKGRRAVGTPFRHRGQSP